jgi:hypothetical protein
MSNGGIAMPAVQHPRLVLLLLLLLLLQIDAPKEALVPIRVGTSGDLKVRQYLQGFSSPGARGGCNLASWRTTAVVAAPVHNLASLTSSAVHSEGVGVLNLAASHNISWLFTGNSVPYCFGTSPHEWVSHFISQVL